MRAPRAILIPLALLAASILSLPATAPASTLAFTAPHMISDEWAFEPSLAVHPDGTLFAGWPQGFPTQQSLVYREDAPGVWTDVSPPPFLVGGGDTDIVFGPDGTMYVADLWLGGITVWSSPDKGETWSAGNPLASGTIADDRMWLAVGADNTVYLVYNQLETGYWVAKSTDGGATFLALPVSDEPGMYPPGTFVATDDVIAFAHAVPIAHNVAGIFGGVGSITWGIQVTRTTDGDNWETVTVARPNGWGHNLFESLTADSAGNLYVVWSEGIAVPQRPLKFSTSTDDGATWSAPKSVGAPAGDTVIPWATAGAPGHLGVAYAHTPGNGNAGTPAWHIRYAVTTDALAASPTWEDAQVSTAPAFTGAVSGRPVIGDFLTARTTLDGDAAVVWGHSIGNSEIRTLFALQTAGPKL